MPPDRRIVLDTNVLVSAPINPSGPPGRILDLVLNGDITLVLDDRILSEYSDVLNRKKLGFEPEDVKQLLLFIRLNAESVLAKPVKKQLPDPGNQPFFEVARAAECKYLVTGNLKHYPRVKEAISPKAFLEQM